jgi:hypothetical protein
MHGFVSAGLARICGRFDRQNLEGGSVPVKPLDVIWRFPDFLSSVFRVETSPHFGVNSGVMKRLLFLLLMLPVCGFGMDRIAALSMLESGDDDQAVGRAGEISRYQIRKTEWRNVTNSANYADSETAKSVVLLIMERRIQTFQSQFKRMPSDFEFYGLWNAPAQIMQRQISAAVADRCQRFANLCDRDQQLAQALRVSKKVSSTVF